jgi:hypothetical protein
MAKNGNNGSSNVANLFMFAVGVGLLVIVLRKYQVREPNQLIIEPAYPMQFNGKVLNELENTGASNYHVMARREKAVNTVAKMILEISSLPIDAFTVRTDLDRLSRVKRHTSCPEDYIFDMMNTLIFDTQYGDPMKGGLSVRQYDAIAFSAAKGYLVLEGLPARSYVTLDDVC